MSDMAADDRKDRRLLCEAVQGPQPKPALGPPHDTYAALFATVALASVLFFSGWTRVEPDWTGWVGFIGSFVVLISLVHYWQRAYGFASRGWGSAPMGAVIAAIFGFMLVNQIVAPAVYSYYVDEGLFGVLVACLAIALLFVAPLRAALGKAMKV